MPFGRKKASNYGNRPNEFKYGMPLYGAAWPPGDHYFVCGGGGHGLVPRLVWARWDRERKRCCDQVGDYRTGAGTETPMRMALAPSGTSILCGMSDGGLRRFQVDLPPPGSAPPPPPQPEAANGSPAPPSSSASSATPRVAEVTAAFADRLAPLRAEEVTAIAFAADGSAVVVGSAGGALRLLSYPAMHPVREMRARAGVRDVDLSPFVRGLAAVAFEDGTAQLWDVALGAPLAELQPPKGVDKPKFARLRFARDRADALYATVNQARSASHLCLYAPPGVQQLQAMQQQMAAAQQREQQHHHHGGGGPPPPLPPLGRAPTGSGAAPPAGRHGLHLPHHLHGHHHGDDRNFALPTSATAAMAAQAGAAGPFAPGGVGAAAGAAGGGALPGGQGMPPGMRHRHGTGAGGGGTTGGGALLPPGGAAAPGVSGVPFQPGAAAAATMGRSPRVSASGIGGGAAAGAENAPPDAAAAAAAAPGEWVLVKRVKVDDGPSSALAVSRSGAFLALGQTSGRLLIYGGVASASGGGGQGGSSASTGDLSSSDLWSRPLADEREANMVFVSAVAFADDESAAMAVGGDANCFVLDLTGKTFLAAAAKARRSKADRRGAGGGGFDGGSSGGGSVLGALARVLLFLALLLSSAFLGALHVARTRPQAVVPHWDAVEQAFMTGDFSALARRVVAAASEAATRGGGLGGGAVSAERQRRVEAALGGSFDDDDLGAAHSAPPVTAGELLLRVQEAHPAGRTAVAAGDRALAALAVGWARAGEVGREAAREVERRVRELRDEAKGRAAKREAEARRAAAQVLKPAGDGGGEGGGEGGRGGAGGAGEGAAAAAAAAAGDAAAGSTWSSKPGARAAGARPGRAGAAFQRRRPPTLQQVQQMQREQREREEKEKQQGEQPLQADGAAGSEGGVTQSPPPTPPPPDQAPPAATTEAAVPETPAAAAEPAVATEPAAATEPEPAAVPPPPPPPATPEQEAPPAAADPAAAAAPPPLADTAPPAAAEPAPADSSPEPAAPAAPADNTARSDEL